MRDTGKTTSFERFWHIVLRGPVRFLTRLRVHGEENIPKDTGCIVCANHIQLYDVFVLSATFPRDRMPKYLAKKELFRIPLLGRLLRAMGAIPLDRGGRDVRAIDTAVTVAKGGGFLTVFPQGTRQKGRNPAQTPIKSGAALIASRAGLPILPVCIAMKNQRYRLFRPVDVYIGRPLSLEELGLADRSRSYMEATEQVFLEACRLGGFLPEAEGGKKA